MKSERGNATLITFASLALIIIIIGTIFTTVVAKRKSQLIETMQFVNTYDGDMATIYTQQESNF